MKKVKLFEDYSLSEKKITLTWNDDDNSIVFSDGEIASVDYDGEFQYRDEWFSTVDHTEADDLIRDLEKRFKRDKFEWIGESYVNEGKVRVFLDKIISSMVEKGLGVAYPHKMREEIKAKIRGVIKDTMEEYDYIMLESEDTAISENLIQNIDSADFDGADPSKIDVHNQGVGGVHTLQGMRTRIVKLLEEMLKDAKMAEKNHKLAHFSLSKVQGLADPTKMGGVFLKYLENHQAAVEELESIRRRGGSGKGKTIPKGLI